MLPLQLPAEHEIDDAGYDVNGEGNPDKGKRKTVLEGRERRKTVGEILPLVIDGVDENFSAY